MDFINLNVHSDISTHLHIPFLHGQSCYIAAGVSEVVAVGPVLAVILTTAATAIPKGFGERDPNGFGWNWWKVLSAISEADVIAVLNSPGYQGPVGAVFAVPVESSRKRWRCPGGAAPLPTLGGEPGRCYIWRGLVGLLGSR